LKDGSAGGEPALLARGEALTEELQFLVMAAE
jgi:hypothetical protein